VLEDTGRNGFGDDLIKDDKVMRKYKKEDILFDEVQNEAFSNLYSVEKRRLAEGGVNTILPTYFKTTYISNI
jgi:predicted transport protein